MADKRDYYEWEEEEKKGLSSKGKAKVASELSNLADLGKKAFGYPESMRDAFRNQKIDPVKKGRSLDSSMSTVDPTRKDKVESESPIFSDEDTDYRKKKKKYGL